MMMEYAVFADLSRPLTQQEQLAVFEALESSVLGSGCVGRDKQPNDEVYFCVNALSEQEASTQAAAYMNTVLQGAKLDVEYTLELQKIRAAKREQ